jgi:hypothetical protein
MQLWFVVLLSATVAGCLASAPPGPMLRPVRHGRRGGRLHPAERRLRRSGWKRRHHPAHRLALQTRRRRWLSLPLMEDSERETPSATFAAGPAWRPRMGLSFQGSSDIEKLDPATALAAPNGAGPGDLAGRLHDELEALWQRLGIGDHEASSDRCQIPDDAAREMWRAGVDAAYLDHMRSLMPAPFHRLVLRLSGQHGTTIRSSTPKRAEPCNR